MQPPPGRTETRRLAGVLCTLAAGYLFAPTPVRADCGDYVTIGSQSATAGHSASPEARGPVSGPRDRHKPCTGPHCSGGTPAAPVLPAIPPAPPSGEDSGLVSAGSAADSDSPPAERWDEFDGLRSIRFSSAVYHPPR